MSATKTELSAAVLGEIFSDFEKDPMLNLVTTDRLVEIGTECDEIIITQFGDTQINITIDGSTTFNVDVLSSAGTFRSILARIGIICDEVTRKATLRGKIRGILIRAGWFPDRKLMEQHDRRIRYISAVIRPQVGSPLYMLDAELMIKKRNGTHCRLAIQMSNRSFDVRLHLRAKEVD